MANTGDYLPRGISQIIIHYAFSPAELLSLDILMGVPVEIKVHSLIEHLYAATRNEICISVQDALSAAALNLWIPAVDALIKYAGNEHDFDFGLILADAAENGNIEAMNFAIARGGTNFDMALAHAAGKGHIAAMRLAIKHGANDFDWALRSAAGGSHIKAMKLARKHGATDFDGAIQVANGLCQKEAIQLLTIYRASFVQVPTGFH